MHSSLVLLALSAMGAMAAPHRNQKREYVYKTDVVTKIVYETVTFGGELPSYTPPVHHPKNGPVNHHPPAYTPAPQPTPEAPKPTPEAPQPQQPSNPNLSEYANKALKHHNLHRANHSAPALEWDEGCAATAQQIANTCVFSHSMDVNGGGYGQNIAAGQTDIGAVVSDMFYNGEVENYQGLYGVANPPWPSDDSIVWGHFTQVVWKDTTQLGCAVATCPNGVLMPNGEMSPMDSFTVCNYKSAGNFAGEYAQNVGEPLGHPVVTV